MKNRRMDFEFDTGMKGNVALTGELDLSRTQEFTVVIAFGETLPSAVSVLLPLPGLAYPAQRRAFREQVETTA